MTADGLRPLRVLVVEDSSDDAEMLIAALRRAGFHPDWTLADTLIGVQLGLLAAPDVVLADYSLPGMTALDVLAVAARVPDPPPVIVVSGVMDEETCVATIRHGAMDYLLKDRLARLGRSVEAAMERRRLQREARAAREEGQVASSLLRSLVGNAPAAICLQSTDGHRLLSNPSYERLPALQSGESADVALTAADHALVREETRGDRTYLAVHYPVSHAAGHTFAYGSIHLDMTEQTRVMAELTQARAELQKRAEALDVRNAALQQLDAMKTQFVATVSHELRTPLTSICGYTELLREGALGALPDMAGDALEVIERNGQRLLGLIDTLLLLSTVDTGSFEPRRQPIDVPALLEGVTAALQPAAAASSIELRVSVATVLPDLLGDRDQLERLLFNLVSNAIKFSATDAQVRVQITATHADLVIRVADDGIGISAEDLPKVFGRFHRADSAYDNEIQGSGLGLAGHGGQITVASELGVGSTFTATLPLAPAAGVMLPTPRQDASAAGEPSTATSSGADRDR